MFKNSDFSGELSNSIEVGKVIGGQKTHGVGFTDVSDEEFKTEMQHSLASSRLLAKRNKAEYELTSKIHTTIPLFDNYVYVDARYILVDRRTGKIIFDEKIKSKSSLPRGATLKVATYDLQVGSQEDTMARNIGAMRANIDKFLEKLSHLKLIE
ncbi:hypothetical protein L4C34_05860 [Vibrio profundum]|uniref:hypothetical protein n=1 Tax=Vibrio profundum TaxID=2910247 RepID=UPI003D12CE22